MTSFARRNLGDLDHVVDWQALAMTKAAYTAATRRRHWKMVREQYTTKNTAQLSTKASIKIDLSHLRPLTACPHTRTEDVSLLLALIVHLTVLVSVLRVARRRQHAYQTQQPQTGLLQYSASSQQVMAAVAC